VDQLKDMSVKWVQIVFVHCYDVYFFVLADLC
jgi:hypothetical protein